MGSALTPVVLDVAGVEAKVDYSDLGAVLEEAIDKDGMLGPEKPPQWSAALDSQLKRLAVVGPTVTGRLFATKEDRLAYWLNARAAWALKLVLLAEFPEEMSPAELEDRSFPLDGRTMTLREIDAVIEKEGGWEALVAAPCLRMQRARLPEKPFEPSDISQRIRDRLSGFIDDKKRFIVDIEHKRVLFPPVLWQCRQELLERHRTSYGADEVTFTTALLPYVSGSAHRRLQDAIGYRCVRARSDRALAVTKED
jgi:hypothetical protein